MKIVKLNVKIICFKVKYAFNNNVILFNRENIYIYIYYFIIKVD